VSFHSAVKSPSGVLALGAAYVKNRYGSDSDGLVCGADAEVPGCVAVRYGADYDHADGAYPRFMSDERYRRYVENISPDGEKEGFEINAFEQKDVEETKTRFFSSRFEPVGELGASETTENDDGRRRRERDGPFGGGARARAARPGRKGAARGGRRALLRRRGILSKRRVFLGKSHGARFGTRFGSQKGAGPTA
jgi:hypothetical protein